MVERPAVNGMAGGSSPSPGAFLTSRLRRTRGRLFLFCLFLCLPARAADRTAAAVAAAIRADYPGAAPAAACRGRFLPKDRVGHAVVVALPDGQLVFAVYVPTGTSARRHELARRKAPPRAAAGQELQCLSPAQVKRRNLDIEETETVEGRIEAKRGHGAVCRSDAGPSFECFEYDPKTDAFVPAGGWST